MLSKIRQWLNVKTWDRTHISIPPISEWKFDPEWNFAASPDDIAWLLKPSDYWITREECEEIESQFELPSDVMKDHKPIPPKSALWRPPNLTPSEKAAVSLVEQYTQASKHLVDLTVPKLKPALKKRKTDVAKGYRRVYFDKQGKMKEVKKKAA